MVDEEILQKRSLEMTDGASSSIPVNDNRITTDGAEFTVVTTRNGPTDDPAGSGKPNPPVC